MTPELLLALLGWATLINFGIFTAWFLAFWLGHGAMHRLHSKWFHLSSETFHALHYGMMAAYKLGIILFNLVPYLALRIVL